MRVFVLDFGLPFLCDSRAGSVCVVLLDAMPLAILCHGELGD